MSSPQSTVLGIWDGHDAGACLLKDGRVLFAANEERFTRRKLEVGFPTQCISTMFSYTGVLARDIALVACSTADPARTIQRLFPGIRRNHYLVRRRLRFPGPEAKIAQAVKNIITRWKPTSFSTQVSSFCLRKELFAIGIEAPLHWVHHHRAHAETVRLLMTPQSEATVLTLDGVGDGASGSVWQIKDGRLNPIDFLPAWPSLGILFEVVTHALNMRELEDEGKIMALASHVRPIPESENPFLNWFHVSGSRISSSLSLLGFQKAVQQLVWKTPLERVAAMAQQALERLVLSLARGILERTRSPRLACSGGLFANVKLNLHLRENLPLEELRIFPHMGDGGLALGAAAHFQPWLEPINNTILWGPHFSSEDCHAALLKFSNLHFSRDSKFILKAAKLILQGMPILWFQGRMEYGPRALGARSILARADRPEIRDTLNLNFKNRSWYQPFCPSLLACDAAEALRDYEPESDALMTQAYRVAPDKSALLSAALGPDQTCRPHIVHENESTAFAALLKEMRSLTGFSALLNTSFNFHGEPLVCTPTDALRLFERSAFQFLFLEDFVVGKQPVSIDALAL